MPVILAISNYAVNLVLFVAGPLGKVLAVSKSTMASIATPVVLLALWWMTKRVRKHLS